MFNKIKAVKDLRSQAKAMQSELDEIMEEGTAAHGKVRVMLNGNQKVLAVKIDDSMLEKKGKLEDAVKDALNDAVKKVQRKMAMKMKDMGGLDMLKNLGG